MDFKDSFDLFLKQTALVNEYWKFYSTVALAILAATVSSDKFKSSKTSVFTVIGTFWLFSIGNLAAIAQGHAVSVKLANFANHLAAESKQTLLQNVAIKIASVGEVCVFHVVCDIAFTTAILLVASHSWKATAVPKSEAQPSSIGAIVTTNKIAP